MAYYGPLSRALAEPLPPFVMSDTMYANNASRLVEASGWVDTAAPLLDAYSTLDQLHANTYDVDSDASREVRRIYAAAMSNVMDEIDAYRDNAIYDAHVGCGDDDMEQEIADEFNGWLSENTTSIRDALTAREALVARMNLETGRG